MDYLAIGHVTEDLWPSGITPGGPVLYAARAATVWLDHVAVLTAAGPDFELAASMPGVDAHVLPAPATTRFRNIHTDSGRRQVTWPAPTRITVADLTPAMLACPLVHVAPVCNEIDVDVVFALPETTFVGVAPQGWMRRWDAEGTVYVGEWVDAARVLPRANAVVISIEDVGGDWALLRRWAQATALLAVTQGAEGCTVFVAGEPTHVPPAPVVPIDATGAGDAFTASLFIALHRGVEPVRAARMASCIAAHSVGHAAGKWFPTRADLLGCLEY
jgi:sugar/nucleoside kinase (ribokinase family)